LDYRVPSQQEGSYRLAALALAGSRAEETKWALLAAALGETARALRDARLSAAAMAAIWDEAYAAGRVTGPAGYRRLTVAPLAHVF
jgi:hypothetical protein